MLQMIEDFPIPVSRSTWEHWKAADQEALASAATKLREAGANPYCFTADARHFWQMATKQDREALLLLTKEEMDAILVDWDDEDWDPEGTFGIHSA